MLQDTFKGDVTMETVTLRLLEGHTNQKSPTLSSSNSLYEAGRLDQHIYDQALPSNKVQQLHVWPLRHSLQHRCLMFKTGQSSQVDPLIGLKWVWVWKMCYVTPGQALSVVFGWLHQFYLAECHSYSQRGLKGSWSVWKERFTLGIPMTTVMCCKCISRHLSVSCVSIIL